MNRQVELKDIFSDYFDEELSRPNSPQRLSESFGHTPVSPNVCNWEIHSSPERFSRTFKFNDRFRLIDFVKDVLIFEDDFGHHGSHKIDFDKVTIEVYTHEINRITELDQEYTKTVDMIFKDVLDYAY